MYTAFLSYSRIDNKIADRLYKALDEYRTPKGLLRDDPSIPFKFYPIFRDRAELSAGGDLDDRVIQALKDSERLIVLCSPAASTSKWVEKEVAEFIRLERTNRIFPVIAATAPDVDDIEIAFFPPSLRKRGLLAADLRKIRKKNGQIVGDNFHDGRLKLIAGLLGVTLETLVQRERRRDQQRRTMLGVFAALVSVLIVAAGGFAIAERQQRQRVFNRRLVTQAENLFSQGADSFHQSLLLSIESMRRSPSAEAADILRAGLPLLPNPVASFDMDSIQDSRINILNDDYVLGAIAEESVSIDIADSQQLSILFDYAIKTPNVDLTGARMGDKRWTEAHTVRDLNGRYEAYYGGPGCQAHLTDMTKPQTSVITPSYKCMFVTYAKFSPNSRYIALQSSTSDTFYFYQIVNLANSSTIKLDSEDVFSVVEFSLDGKYVATQDKQSVIRVGSSGDMKTLWSISSDAETPSDNFDLAEFSDNGNFLIVRNGSSVQVRKSATGEIVSSFNPSIRDQNNFFRITLDSEEKYIVTSGDNSSQLWHVLSGKEVVRLEHEPSLEKNVGEWKPVRIVFPQSDSFISVVDTSGVSRIWNIENKWRSAEIDLVHAGPVLNLAFSPDSNHLATADQDGEINLWNVRSSEKITTFNVPVNDRTMGFWNPESVFSPDGQYLVTSVGNQSSIQVWDVDSGQEVARLNYRRDLDSTVNLISSSAIEFKRGRNNRMEVVDNATRQTLATLVVEGRKIVVADDSQHSSGKEFKFEKIGNTLFVTEADSGKEVGKISHKGEIQDVVLSPDGSYIASASSDGTVKVRRLLTSDALISEVCQRINRSLTRDEWKQFFGRRRYRETCDV